jgi:hypothetical protein
MLPSVGQLLAFLLSILYLAISASILTALISLSVIADINTTMEQRVIYQWGYFFLLYFLIRMQKTAILGLTHQHYLESLPVSVKLKHTNTVLLTLVAGNLPLLAPLFILTFIPDWSTFISQLHFPIFVLSVFMVALLSLKNKTLPWISLVFAPVILLLGFEEYALSAISMNSAMLLLLVIEAYFEPLSFILNKSWSVKYYCQIRWIAIMKNPTNAVVRLLFCCLFLGMFAYVQYKMEQVANAYIQILFCWLLAIVIGSYQFDNQRFYQQYHLYINGLFNQFYIRYCLDILPAMFVSIISCVLMYIGLSFPMEMIVLLSLEVLITMICVSKFHRNFFIIPSLLSGLIMFMQ